MFFFGDVGGDLICVMVMVSVVMCFVNGFVVEYFVVFVGIVLFVWGEYDLCVVVGDEVLCVVFVIC